MFRHLVLALVLLVLAAVPAAAIAPDADACAGASLPYAVNIGLPRLPDAPGFRARDLEEGVQRLIGTLYARHGLCPERQVQANITVAGDYEILDWLAQGLVDVAIVPDLTVHLLERDGILFKEIELIGHRLGGLLLPSLRPQPRSARLDRFQWQRRPDPQADFAAFQEQIWRLAIDPPAQVEPQRYRVVLASHLSSLGFLAPLDETGRNLDKRLASIAEGERNAVRERFWQAFFEHTRFAVDCDSLVRDSPPGSRSCWRLPDAEERAGSGPVEVLFPGEGVLRPLVGPSAQVGTVPPGRFREHLVMSNRVAEDLFGPRMEMKNAQVQLPAGIATLLTADPPVPALAPLLKPEPTFGVRTFRFTVDEIFGLLRRQQRTSGRHDLALVLPGGGVKAAYQSTVVDSLYHQGYLKNFQAEPAPGSAEPLDVQYVIGTSGGALLGFFVSQLGENGPWGLSDILWKKADGSFVESTDIFAWTDLLRYLSVIVSFLVLCGLIALASIPERSPLSPEPAGKGMGVRRPLTLGVLLPVLFLAPLLVRQVNGDALQEHVPEIEGLFYAILAMIAMVTDQALVRLNEERRGGELWVRPSLPVAVGAVLVLLPLLPWGDSRVGELLRGSLTFGPAFGVLAPLVLLGGLILPLRSRLPGGASGRRTWLRPVLHFLAGAGLALAAAFLLPPSWLDVIKMPFFLAGFLLVLVSVGANFLLAARTGLGERARQRIYWGALVLSSLLLIAICWPEAVETGTTWEGMGESLRAQTLDVPVGSFLLGIGLVILMLGGIAWVYASRRRYHLRLTEFLVPYFVVLLHAVAVYLVLVLVIALPLEWLSPLELTREFWLWLLATSLVLGTLLLLAALGKLGGRAPAAAGRRWSAVVGYLHRSFAFLGSHHPNGDVITRRFMRMAVWSVCCLGWWNLVVAPALYGNRSAFRYLTSAAEQFRTKAGLEGVPYRPTARFIAPANLLEKDGTRYFLFVPEGVECPPIPPRPASGARWLSYEASFGGQPAVVGSRRCQPVPDPVFLRDVIFASGSPFPIFPAHRVQLEGEKRPLVDGGYSNNVPVDVALTVSASQVLIVDSTNPLGHESPPPTFLSRSADRVLGFRGKLVENLGRLPGFLFERSQQVDRLSRRDLFVVSLAPSRDEPDWPPLFDFRQQTVERMEEVAQRDIGRRIGMVQSWGRPRFQLSVPVKGLREEGSPAAEKSDPPAS